MVAMPAKVSPHSSNLKRLIKQSLVRCQHSGCETAAPLMQHDMKRNQLLCARPSKFSGWNDGQAQIIDEGWIKRGVF